MSREILFATNNPTKAERFRFYYEPLGLMVISFSDLGKIVEVVEDGQSAEENSFKKAMAGHKATGLPCFGVDYWLRIEGLAEKLQPGPYVRRIFKGKNNKRVEATDKEMLDYYTSIVRRLGGKTKGKWTSAITLVINSKTVFSQTFSRETILSSQRSPRVTPGEPLNSIQIDPATGQYFADLSPQKRLEMHEEREKRYLEFMKSHLDDLI